VVAVRRSSFGLPRSFVERGELLCNFAGSWIALAETLGENTVRSHEMRFRFIESPLRSQAFAKGTLCIGDEVVTVR
jgi:hypothetical protein